MQKRYGKIIGWGAYTPPTVVTNFDLEEKWETTDEWIVQRSGIRERHYASEAEPTDVLATKAAQKALETADIDPSSLDLIIVGTCLTEMLTPSVACMVQDNIGAKDVPAYDISAGCTGFLYSISTAYQFIQTGAYQRILVIGAENISRFLHVADRSAAVLFGDAAAAVIIEGTDERCGLHGFMLGSDGSGRDLLALNTSTQRGHFDEGHYIHFNGRPVFRFASRILGKACQQALDMAGMSLDDVDWIIPHQANVRIIESAARNMGVSMDKFIINIEKYGNTSAASIPLALYEGLESGKVKPNDTILMVAFGAGLTWGAAVLQLAPKAKASQTEQLDFASNTHFSGTETTEAD
ncbi:MAG: 3-oxoacyl-[acyl-carrier-protein] synthase-3 [Cellvibrionaceae bacterium]|jgi:3-oxoacyl-[acyl-carrier-protein] synthase-3